MRGTIFRLAISQELRIRNLLSSYDYTILPFHIQASEAMNPEDDMPMPMSGDGEVYIRTGGLKAGKCGSCVRKLDDTT